MSQDLEAIRKQIQELNTKLDTVKDILRSSASSDSKPFVDEFMSECKETSHALQNSTDFILSQNGQLGPGGLDPEHVFGSMMEALEEFNNVENQYNEWTARMLVSEDEGGGGGTENFGAVNQTIAPSAFQSNNWDSNPVPVMDPFGQQLIDQQTQMFAFQNQGQNQMNQMSQQQSSQSGINNIPMNSKQSQKNSNSQAASNSQIQNMANLSGSDANSGPQSIKPQSQTATPPLTKSTGAGQNTQQQVQQLQDPFANFYSGMIMDAGGAFGVKGGGPQGGPLNGIPGDGGSGFNNNISSSQGAGGVPGLGPTVPPVTNNPGASTTGTKKKKKGKKSSHHQSNSGSGSQSNNNINNATIIPGSTSQTGGGPSGTVNNTTSNFSSMPNLGGSGPNANNSSDSNNVGPTGDDNFKDFQTGPGPQMSQSVPVGGFPDDTNFFPSWGNPNNNIQEFPSLDGTGGGGQAPTWDSWFPTDGGGTSGVPGQQQSTDNLNNNNNLFPSVVTGQSGSAKDGPTTTSQNGQSPKDNNNSISQNYNNLNNNSMNDLTQSQVGIGGVRTSAAEGNMNFGAQGGSKNSVIGGPDGISPEGGIGNTSGQEGDGVGLGLGGDYSGMLPPGAASPFLPIGSENNQANSHMNQNDNMMNSTQNINNQMGVSVTEVSGGAAGGGPGNNSVGHGGVDKLGGPGTSGGQGQGSNGNNVMDLNDSNNPLALKGAKQCVMRLENLRLSDIEDTIGIGIFQEIFVTSVAEACGISRDRIEVTGMRPAMPLLQ